MLCKKNIHRNLSMCVDDITNTKIIKTIKANKKLCHVSPVIFHLSPTLPRFFLREAIKKPNESLTVIIVSC